MTMGQFVPENHSKINRKSATEVSYLSSTQLNTATHEGN